jgi:3-hydroxyacyl-[acyl-carrier-protein] dehydratase
MIETAAQLSSYAYKQYIETDSFLGFAGVDEVKFRGTVEPPARLVIIGKAVQLKPRRMITLCQGFVDSTMVFEAKITGMPI